MKNDGVFPQGVAIGGGMSKREYFSIKLMQSMVAVEPKGNKPAETQKAMVALAIQFADALLEALDGKN